MKRAGAATLASIEPLLRQIRQQAGLLALVAQVA